MERLNLLLDWHLALNGQAADLLCTQLGDGLWTAYVRAAAQFLRIWTLHLVGKLQTHQMICKLMLMNCGNEVVITNHCCRPSGMSAGSETGDLRPLLGGERSSSGRQTTPERLSRTRSGQATADSADAKVCIC